MSAFSWQPEAFTPVTAPYVFSVNTAGQLAIMSSNHLDEGNYNLRVTLNDDWGSSQQTFDF